MYLQLHYPLQHMHTHTPARPPSHLPTCPHVPAHTHPPALPHAPARPHVFHITLSNLEFESWFMTLKAGLVKIAPYWTVAFVKYWRHCNIENFYSYSTLRNKRLERHSTARNNLQGHQQQNTVLKDSMTDQIGSESKNYRSNEMILSPSTSSIQMLPWQHAHYIAPGMFQPRAGDPVAWQQIVSRQPGKMRPVCAAVTGN